MNKRMLEMCIGITQQGLGEWHPYITLQEYIFLKEELKGDRK